MCNYEYILERESKDKAYEESLVPNQETHIKYYKMNDGLIEIMWIKKKNENTDR